MRCARGASAAPYLLCIVWVRARSFNLCMRWLTCCRVAVGSSWEQNVYIVRSNDDLDFYQCPPAKNVIFDLVARPHRAQAQHTTYTASPVHRGSPRTSPGLYVLKQPVGRTDKSVIHLRNTPKSYEPNHAPTIQHAPHRPPQTLVHSGLNISLGTWLPDHLPLAIRSCTKLSRHAAQ